MKKALCFFLAIVFVCCVITHGKNERFSLEAFLNNITNFEDMPTIQDVVDCWQNDKYYVGNVQMLPYWITIRTPIVPILEKGANNPVVTRGLGVLALNADGTEAKHSEYDITYCYLYDFDDQPYYHTFEDGSVSDTNKYPVIFEYQKEYVEYEGDNEILQFFSTIKGFFVRLWDCLGVVFRMVKTVFTNLKYLLPWNSTVPRGAI